MWWVAVMKAAETGGQIGGGVRGYKDAKQYGNELRVEGDRMLEEAKVASARILDEADRFAQNQKMQYIGSGVEYAGSAIVNVQQTQAWGKEEAAATLAAGYRAQAEAQKQAKRAKAQGKMQMIQSFFGAAGSGAEAYGAAKK